jgi:hypothetical protein
MGACLAASGAPYLLVSGGGKMSRHQLLERNGTGGKAVSFPLRRRRLEASMAATQGWETAAAAVPVSASWRKKKRVAGWPGPKGNLDGLLDGLGQILERIRKLLFKFLVVVLNGFK